MEVIKSVIIKYNNSLAGYKAFNWRYKNGGWKLISQMPEEWQSEMRKEHRELLGASDKGATKEQMLSYGHKENKNGGFRVEWDFKLDIPDKPKKINYEYSMSEKHILDNNKECDLPKDFDLSSSYAVYVSEYRKKFYCGVLYDTDSCTDLIGEYGPFKTEKEAFLCGKDMGDDWLYCF